MLLHQHRCHTHWDRMVRLSDWPPDPWHGPQPSRLQLPRYLRNEVCNRVHKSPQLVPKIRRMQSALIQLIFHIHFNIIRPSMFTPPTWSSHLQIFWLKFLHAFLISILHARCPTHIFLLNYRYSTLLSPSGHYMYHQFNIQQFHVLPTECIYVFCVDMRTNIDYFPIQH